MKQCRLCKKNVKGRSDKIFCSVACKTTYHKKLNLATRVATRSTDTILHRNRSILLEVMGKNKSQIKIPKMVLDKKRFNYLYFTGIHKNKKGKTYIRVYDFSYMIFTDNEVLIVRTRTI